MKKTKKQQEFHFHFTDLIPRDVWDLSLLAAYFLLFPVLLILIANQFNYWDGVLTERVFLFFLFLMIGAVGTKVCRKILMISMLVLFWIWDCADLFCFLQLKTQIEPVFLRLLETTNPNECAGFLKHTLFRWSNLILLFYPLCGIGIWLFAKKYRSFLLPAAGLLLIGGSFLLFDIAPAHNGITRNLYERIDQTLDQYAEDELKATLLELANSDLNVSASEKDMTMILVIGESHSKGHSSLYGYTRETNPLLKKRAENGELTVFTDVVAPHSFTMYSVPKMLTFAAHDVQESFLEVPNIFDLAKSAGFKTFWLCNHPAMSDQNMPYAVITERADVIHHSSTGNVQKSDEALFPAYQSALDDPAPRKLIVLQLIGSHHDYEQTYPETAAIFPLDSGAAHFNEEQKKHRKMVNAYDNSIRYNDFILDELIRKFAGTGRKGFLLYLPDHGENLYEQPGMVMHMEFMPTLQSVEIPMYLYLSKDHPDKTIAPAVRNRPFASEDLPYLLLHLGRLHYPGADMKKSLFAPGFQPKKRIVSGCSVDYDKLKRDGHGNLTNETLK